MITAIKCCDGTNKLSFGKGLSPSEATSIFRTSERDLGDVFRRCDADSTVSAKTVSKAGKGRDGDGGEGDDFNDPGPGRG